MLVTLLAIVLQVAAIIVIVATAMLVLQAGSALFLRDRPFNVSARWPSIAVLVPAHNEERDIEATVLAIKQDLRPTDQVIVVADNCNDETAVLAARAGAKVVVRNDLSRQGKGFALAAGLHHLAMTAPEIVVCVDADCQFNANGIERLARACATLNSPLQCLYLMVANPGSPAPPRLAEFAWRIRNDLRPTGYARLGLPCHLFGSGMAFPWQLIEPDRFATGHITEDTLLGLEFALKEHPPRFFRESRVTSRFPTGERSQELQRQRWVHGQLGLLKSHGPRLAYQGLRRRDFGLLALAADLAVPPLGLLVAADISLVILSLGCLIVGGTGAPLLLAVFAGCLLSIFLAAAWRLCGRDLIGFREVSQLPRHVIAVVRSAINLVRGRKSQWVRADRL